MQDRSVSEGFTGKSCGCVDLPAILLLHPVHFQRMTASILTHLLSSGQPIPLRTDNIAIYTGRYPTAHHGLLLLFLLLLLLTRHPPLGTVQEPLLCLQRPAAAILPTRCPISRVPPHAPSLFTPLFPSYSQRN